MLLGLSLFSEDGEGYAAEPGGEGLVQVGGTSTIEATHTWCLRLVGAA